MDISKLSPHLPAVTDVYTDLSGLQQLKAEQDKDQALKKVAQQFESMFINLMMKNMRSANAVFEEDSLFNSKESQFFRDMHDQQLSLTMAHGKGIGIADALYRQMSRSYGEESGDQSGDESGERKGEVASEALKENKGLEKGALNPHDLNARMHAMINQSSVNQANSALSHKEGERTLHSSTLQKSPLPTSASPLRQHAAEQVASSKVKGKSVDDRVAIADSPREFVEKLLPYARKAAQIMGVDHYLLIAQSALETGWGKFVLSNEEGNSSHNLFNIKKGLSKQASVQHATLEFRDGTLTKENAEFRVYDDIASSFEDYVQFVQDNSRYEEACKVAEDSYAYISQLHKAGYATDPEYSDKVLRVFKQVKQLAEELPLNNVSVSGQKSESVSTSRTIDASDQFSAPLTQKTLGKAI